MSATTKEILRCLGRAACVDGNSQASAVPSETRERFSSGRIPRGLLAAPVHLRPLRIGFDQWREEQGRCLLSRLAECPNRIHDLHRPDPLRPEGKVVSGLPAVSADVPIYNIDLPYPLFQKDQDHRDVWDYYTNTSQGTPRSGQVVEKQTGKKMITTVERAGI